MATNKRLALISGHLTPSNEYMLNEISKSSSSDSPTDFIFPGSEDLDVMQESYATPMVAENLLRKSLYDSIQYTREQEKGLLAIVNLLVNPSFSISETDTRIMDRVEHIANHPTEKLLLNKEELTYQQFLKSYGIENISVRRQETVVFYGQRDVMIIKFRPEFYNMINYQEPYPRNYIVLTRLIAFLEDCMSAYSIADSDASFVSQTKEDIVNARQRELNAQDEMIKKDLQTIEITSKTYDDMLTELVQNRIKLENNFEIASAERELKQIELKKKEDDLDKKLIELRHKKDELIKKQQEITSGIEAIKKSQIRTPTV